MNKFDFKKFRQTAYEDRTAVILLEEFGDSKETLEWMIRGLSAEDIIGINAAAETAKKARRAIIESAAAVGGNETESDAIAELVGVGKGVSEVLVRQMAIFQLGSVDPKVESRADAVKFARVHPIEFNKISNEIWRLTGFGQAQKKKPN